MICLAMKTLSSTVLMNVPKRSLVRPTLEYSSPVWDPYLLKDIQVLEKVRPTTSNAFVSPAADTDQMFQIYWCHRQTVLLKKRFHQCQYM